MMWRLICLVVLITSGNPAFAQLDTVQPQIPAPRVIIPDILSGETPFVQHETVQPLISAPPVFIPDFILGESPITRHDTVPPLIPAPLVIIIVKSIFGHNDIVDALIPSPLVLISDTGKSQLPLYDTERMVTTVQYSPNQRDSLRHAFRKGAIHGNLRYFFMSTDNNGSLTDYFANAAGGSLRYETRSFHRFSAAIGAGCAVNLGSSDLTKPDSATGQFNRYEIGLFDIRDPGNKRNMVRLEQLYMEYSFAEGFVRFGKLGSISRGFINGQDGRIRPTVEEGLWTFFRLKEHASVEGGWLYGISPRSTYQWFSIGKSIGWNSQGVNPDGSKSAYRDNLASGGIGIIAFSCQIDSFSFYFTEQYASNLFNTALLLARHGYKIGKRNELVFSFETIKQDAISDGGNADPASTYFPKGGRSWVFGGQALWQYRHNFTLSLNATRITKDGRYLMPREWGNDPFFTFMQRERNEGLGDVMAFKVKAGYSLAAKRLSLELAAGHYNLPEVTNFALNKYGLPSYNQFNLDLRYAFGGLFEGLDARMLYVYKKNAGDLHGDARYEINKVNMSHIDLVLNFVF